MNRKEIERFLPGVVQRTAVPGTPLPAILKVMEALHEPSEAVLTNLDATFDPLRTPGEFVPFLARWVYLDRIFEETAGVGRTSLARAENPISTGLGRLRELIAAAAYLSNWRGTSRGLLLFLETATGLTGFVIEENVPGLDHQPRPFHLRIFAPEAARIHQALIERIIEQEKPAYVTYQLEFR